MLSLNKLLKGNRSCAYVVSVELPDGNDHRIIKSRKFDCSGVDELGVQVNAIQFIKGTDTVSEFREFLFGESDGSGRDEKRMAEGRVDKTADARSLVQQWQTVSQRTRFRSYVCMREKQLTGIRYAVAMCHLESGQLRSISFFRSTSADEGAGGRGEFQALGKAVQFLRSVAFENWRRQVSRELGSRNRGMAAGNYQSSGKERGLKHPHSSVEIEQGGKVDCICGKNRSHGLMMACERCGAWEHAECQGFRSKKQIPADYICSACVRAQGEEVTVIRCEEQEKYWSVDSEDTLAGMTFREQEDCISVCCLCGCEDNEYFESLVQPCSCTGCSVVAHTSCITIVKVGAAHREQHLQRLGVCCFCGSALKDGVGSDRIFQKGGRWTEQVPDGGNAVLANGDQVAAARKRLRSTSGSGAVAGKAEFGEKLSVKSSRNERGPSIDHLKKVQSEVSTTDLKGRETRSRVPPLDLFNANAKARYTFSFSGRHLAFLAANVPIKKRRIQLEMARSPSPPSGSLLPQPDVPAVHEHSKSSGSQVLEGVNATVTIESDGKGGVSLNSYRGAHAQKFDSETLVTALKVSEEDVLKIDGQSKHAIPSDRMCCEVDATGHSVPTPGTSGDVSNINAQCTQVGHSDLAVGCMSREVECESKQVKGIKCDTENGTTAGNRLKEGSSWILEAGVQERQITPVHAGSVIPSREGEQAFTGERVNMSEHLLCTGLLKTDYAEGQLDSKRKYSETDMGSPVRDHLEVEGSSRSRPGFRAVNANFQANVTSNAMMEASTPAGKDNNLRDDRLHWDLNMDMEEWERPTEEDSDLATAENLSVIAKIGVEKGSLCLKESVEEPHSDSGASVSVTAGFEDGRLEQNLLPQEMVDAIEKSNASENSGGPLLPEMQAEREDEAGLMPTGSCNAYSSLDEGHLGGTLLSVPPSGGVVGIRADKQYDYVEDESERVSHNLRGVGPTAVLHKDNRCRELEISSGLDQEAEAPCSEGPLSVVGPTIDKDSKDKVNLVTKDSTDLEFCSSELTDIKASTSCAYEKEDISGTCSVKDLLVSPSGAACVLLSERQLGDYGENSSQIGDLEEEGMVAAQEPTFAFPAANMSPNMNVIRTKGCDEEEGAPFEDKNSVDKEVVEEFITDRKQSCTSPSIQPATLKWEGDNGEDLEAEDVDYGDSDLREVDDIEVEDRSQPGAPEVESIWNPCGDLKMSEMQGASASHGADIDGLSNVRDSCGLTRKRRYHSEKSGAGSLQRMAAKDYRAVKVKDPKCDSVPGKTTTGSEINGSLVIEEKTVDTEHGNGSASIATSDSRLTSLERTEDVVGTARSANAIRRSEVWRESSEGGSRVRNKSGWDQLPEGFQSAEEALQAARSNAGQTGWGPHYGPSFPGWNVNSNSHYGSGDNRYVPGHGRGMLSGPGADRVAFDRTAWSRGDHLRRSRMDDGLEMHVRVPVNQEFRQNSGSRATRPSTLEPAHRQRRRNIWADDTGAAPPMWSYGPGRPISPSGPLREPFGFHPHKTRNAAAVAAAKVESSGLVVAPDGTVIKAGVGSQVPLRGLIGEARGGGFSSMGDMTPNGVITGVGNTGLSHSLRIGDVDLRGRECLGVDTRVAGDVGMGTQCTDPPLRFKGVGERFGASFPPGVGSSMAHGASDMLGNSSRFRWTRGERNFAPPVEPEERMFPGKRRPLDTSSLPQPRSRSGLSTPPRSITNTEVIPDDGAACQPRKSRGTQFTDMKPEAEAEVAPAESQSPASPVVAPPPKLPLPPPPPRAQRSPPAGLKRLINKGEVDWPRGRARSRDKEREWDREKVGSRGHYSPSRRSSPHVIHGSALTDERDRLLLAGIDKSRDQGASLSTSTEDVLSHRGRSMEVVQETKKVQHHDGRKQDADAHMAKGEECRSRTQCKDVTFRGGDVRDSRSETDLDTGRASGSRMPSAFRSDARRDCQKSGVSYKHSSSREGEDDVAPRRRRPS